LNRIVFTIILEINYAFCTKTIAFLTSSSAVGVQMTSTFWAVRTTIFTSHSTVTQNKS